MDEAEAFRMLDGIFREVFDDDALSVKPETSAKDIPGWDSFNHINIIIAAETRFGVKFTTAEVERLRNVGDFVALILQKMAS